MYTGIIYIITNLINNKIYIGQTKQKLNKRINGHISKSRELNPNMDVCKAIKEFGFENFEIKEIERFHLDDRDKLNKLLNEREKYWIRYYDSYNNGYNGTIGGDLSEMSVLKKSIPVDVYDLKGNLLFECKSVTDAGRITGACKEGVDQCCLGKANTANGYTFRFHGDSFDKYSVYAKHSKKVYKIDINTHEVIDCYGSMAEAGRNNNGDKSSIREAVIVGRPFNGFLWSLTEDAPIKKSKEYKKKVGMYDDNYNLIKSFESFADAIRYFDYPYDGKSNPISYACKNNKKLFNYYWKEII